MVKRDDDLNKRKTENLKSTASTLISKINLVPILGFLLIVAAFSIGVLWTKVRYLERGTSARATGSIGDNSPDSQLPPENSGPVEVSVDDDPVMGDEKAPVTVVEFVDYECPFCKSFFDETLPKIKSEYIDTGKVRLVMRDLPLDFHQNAHKEAQAAECAREQNGDDVYFKYHDEIFKRTTSNGTGLALDQLSVIANDIGLNGSTLQSCLDSEKYKDEVDKDLADAAAYGASGTPTFFIGKSDPSGKFQGTILVGAQPLSTFTQTIDALLK
jgi:protein-disulfide isomerase